MQKITKGKAISIFLNSQKILHRSEINFARNIDFAFWNFLKACNFHSFTKDARRQHIQLDSGVTSELSRFFEKQAMARFLGDELL